MVSETQQADRNDTEYQMPSLVCTDLIRSSTTAVFLNERSRPRTARPQSVSGLFCIVLLLSNPNLPVFLCFLHLPASSALSKAFLQHLWLRGSALDIVRPERHEAPRQPEDPQFSAGCSCATCLRVKFANAFAESYTASWHLHEVQGHQS